MILMNFNLFTYVDVDSEPGRGRAGSCLCPTRGASNACNDIRVYLLPPLHSRFPSCFCGDNEFEGSWFFAFYFSTARKLNPIPTRRRSSSTPRMLSVGNFPRFAPGF